MDYHPAHLYSVWFAMWFYQVDQFPPHFDQSLTKRKKKGKRLSLLPVSNICD